MIDVVTAGETFVITRNGEPVDELRPIRAGRRTFVSRDEVAALAAAGVRIDHRQFRADLDRLVDQRLGSPDYLVAARRRRIIAMRDRYRQLAEEAR